MREKNSWLLWNERTNDRTEEMKGENGYQDCSDKRPGDHLNFSGTMTLSKRKQKAKIDAGTEQDQLLSIERQTKLFYESDKGPKWGCWKGIRVWQRHDDDKKSRSVDLSWELKNG